MGKVAIAIGTILGILGLTGASIWLANQLYFPSSSPLVQDATFLEGKKVKDEYKNKYGSKYANFLVGLSSDNAEWWNWSFGYFYKKDQAKGGFKELTRGAKGDATDGKSLQEACEKAYKSESTNVMDNLTEDNDNSKFLASQVWKYCSAISEMPKTLDDMEKSSGTNEDKTKLEGDWKESKVASDKKSDLLAIFTKDNHHAWTVLMYRAFFSEETSEFFKYTPGKTIRDKCEEAYGQNKNSTTTTPSEDDLYKWCSLKGYKETTTSDS